MAGRSPSLARHAPLKRSQVEDAVVIKRTAKTPMRKGAFKPSVPSKTARKSKGTGIQSKQKKEELRELLRKANATNVQLSSDTPSSASLDDDASATVSSHQDVEMIESEPDELEATQALSPSPPTLPLMEIVISFVINGNEAGERSFEVDMNEDYNAFQYQLESYVNKKLPTGLFRWSEDVKVSYQRAYVTKPQERRRKGMPWKDFVDERDYSGLLNAIRSESKPSKMVIVVRAFITIPKDKFEEEVEPVLASQRLTVTSQQQKKASALLAQDAHAREFHALQDQWKCQHHPGQYCYKRYDALPPSEHVQLDVIALSDWAAAIVNKARGVNVECPPRGPEWDKFFKITPRKASSSSFDTPQPFNHPAAMPPIIVQPPPSRSPPRVDPQHTPHRSPRHHDRSSPPYYYRRDPATPTRRRPEPISPIILVEHASWAPFDGDGLRAFIAHCEDKFRVGNATEFQEAYRKLVEHVIRPDIMRGKDVTWYEGKGIKSGTAERIVKVFDRWYAKLTLGVEI